MTDDGGKRSLAMFTICQFFEGAEGPGWILRGCPGYQPHHRNRGDFFDVLHLQSCKSKRRPTATPRIRDRFRRRNSISGGTAFLSCSCRITHQTKERVHCVCCSRCSTRALIRVRLLLAEERLSQAMRSMAHPMVMLRRRKIAERRYIYEPSSSFVHHEEHTSTRLNQGKR